MTDKLGKQYKNTVFIQKDFVFIVPDKNKPIKLKVGQENVIDVKEPTIFSRFIDTYRLIDDKEEFPIESIQFGKTTFAAIVSDRKIYSPQDTAYVLIGALSLKTLECNVKIFRNDQFLFEDRITVSDLGTAIYKIAGVELGEYRVELAAANQYFFKTTFSVAEFELSPLSVMCEKMTLEEGKHLTTNLSVEVLNNPYTGSIDIGVRCGVCGEQIVLQGTFQVKEGKTVAKFDVSGHGGPFSYEITTPTGLNAFLRLESTKSSEIEEIPIANLGKVFQGSLVPREGAEEQAAMFFRETGTETSAFNLESLAIKENIELKIYVPLDRLKAVFYNPLTHEWSQEDHTDVPKGILALTHKLASPYEYLFIAGLKVEAKQVFNNYAILFDAKGKNNAVELKVPDRARPGERIELEISPTDSQPHEVFLLVYDQRLDHESLYSAIGRQQFPTLKNNLSTYQYLTFKWPWEVEEEREREKAERKEMMMDRRAFEAAPSPAMAPPSVKYKAAKMMAPQAAPKPAMTGAMAPSVTTIAGFSPNQMSLTDGSASDSLELSEPEVPQLHIRGESPKLLLCKRMVVKERFIETLQIGDRIGYWTIKLYGFNGTTFYQIQSHLLSIQPNYVEVEVPPFIDVQNKDSCDITVYFKVETVGQLSVALNEEILLENVNVKGTGTKVLSIKDSGVLRCTLVTDQEQQELLKKITIPLHDTIQASELSYLQSGQEFVNQGNEVLVYDSVWSLMGHTIDSLVAYPFGCAEQTSSKLGGLAYAHAGVKSGLQGDINQITTYIKGGIARMQQCFFHADKNLFSLWEKGEPSVEVTQRVLTNLIPLFKIKDDFPEVKALFVPIVEELLKRKVYSDALIPYNDKFYQKGAVKSVEQAVGCIRYLSDSKTITEAYDFLSSSAHVSGNVATWESKGAWGGVLEATCLAALAFYKKSPTSEYFIKAFNFISSKFVNGRLYSTADTKILIDLLNEMQVSQTRSKISIDNQEISLSEPMKTTASIKVLSGAVIVRRDYEKEVAYDEINPNFACSVDMSTSFKIGDKPKISIKLKDTSIAPLVKIWLPAQITTIKGGGNAHLIYQPIFGDSLTIDLIAIRLGTGHVRVLVHDMYNSEKIGIPPPLKIKIQ